MTKFLQRFGAPKSKFAVAIFAALVVLAVLSGFAYNDGAAQSKSGSTISLDSPVSFPVDI